MTKIAIYRTLMSRLDVIREYFGDDERCVLFDRKVMYEIGDAELRELGIDSDRVTTEAQTLFGVLTEFLDVGVDELHTYSKDGLQEVEATSKYYFENVILKKHSEFFIIEAGDLSFGLRQWRCPSEVFSHIMNSFLELLGVDSESVETLLLKDFINEPLSEVCPHGEKLLKKSTSFQEKQVDTLTLSELGILFKRVGNVVTMYDTEQSTKDSPEGRTFGWLKSGISGVSIDSGNFIEDFTQDLLDVGYIFSKFPRRELLVNSEELFDALVDNRFSCFRFSKSFEEEKQKYCMLDEMFWDVMDANPIILDRIDITYSPRMEIHDNTNLPKIGAIYPIEKSGVVFEWGGDVSYLLGCGSKVDMPDKVESVVEYIKSYVKLSVEGGVTYKTGDPNVGATVVTMYQEKYYNMLSDQSLLVNTANDRFAESKDTMTDCKRRLSILERRYNEQGGEPSFVNNGMPFADFKAMCDDMFVNCTRTREELADTHLSERYVIFQRGEESRLMLVWLFNDGSVSVRMGDHIRRLATTNADVLGTESVAVKIGVLVDYVGFLLGSDCYSDHFNVGSSTGERTVRTGNVKASTLKRILSFFSR